MRCMFFDFFQFFVIIECYEWFVMIEGFKGFYWFYGICINDLVPDLGLPLLFGHLFDVFIDDHELGHGCNIKTGPNFKERPDNFRI